MGALWIRSKDGKEYMTGVVTIGDIAHQIVVFKNNKQKPNQPDWRIYKSKPKPVLNENGTEKVTNEPTLDAFDDSSVPF